MHNYTTVSEAINGLTGRGYTHDFNARAGKACKPCHPSGTALSPEEFEIDEVHRFEGLTDPGDEMILYAISSAGLQIKGILLSAYGMYEEQLTSCIVQNLSFRSSSI
ncbi:phosphoribosylpyrophosphate synthetase [Mucilaginibacter terrenus]|uniref:Phosphoribosylpyrophosphate synthetase n=2 Tax=Mucilaginibacter terrenus TaxID=2482727 RepID=A0A3E2NVU7_9SPHI|nr:phosphoribosylpyrophosphate synthetase [Mucilaginibacter terrenus]